MNAPQKISVTEVGRYRDGGTVQYVNDGGLNFWYDNRIGTKTRGAIFDRHPSDQGAQRLNVELVISPKEVSIKQ